MKFYSEKTKTLYDTEEALKLAEDALEAKKSKDDEKRKARADAAKKVEEAFEEAEIANKKARNMLSDFCKKYGSYHTSITSPCTNIFDWFDAFLGI